MRDGFWIEPGVPLPDLSNGTTRPLLVGVVAVARGRAFFQRRLADHPVFPSHLDVLGGFPRPGESVPAAIARIVTEETGFKVDRVVSCAGFATWQSDAGEFVETEYAVEVAGDLDRPSSRYPVRDFYTWADADELDTFRTLGERGAYLHQVVANALRDVAKAPHRPTPLRAQLA